MTLPNSSFAGDYFYDPSVFNIGTVTDETIVTSREVVLFITLTCCIGPLNLIGIVTNALSVIVFQKYPTRGSTTFLLQVLSVADSVFLLNNILLLSVQYYFAYYGKYFDFYKLYGDFTPILKGFTELSRDYSVWCVVLTTVDRFLGICYPLTSPKWCDVRKAGMASCVLLLYTTIFNIPEFLFSKVENFGDIYEQLPTDLGNNFEFNAVYFTFDVVLNLLLPMWTVLYMNCRICWEIIRARRHRLTMARGNLPRHQRMTTMLITVAIFFLLCQIPRVAVNIFNCQDLYWELRNSGSAMTMGESVPFALYAISHILQNCNALGNFYIYCVTGKQFRSVLWQVCRCKRNNRRHSFSTEETRRFSIASSTLRKVSS